jgi:SSU ribosomal protein S17P
MTVVKLQSRPKTGDVIALPQGKKIRVRDVGIPTSCLQPPCATTLCVLGMGILR